MSNSLLTITDASFETDVLKANKPVLLDFWAEWCGPCKAITPILEAVAASHADKLHIAKLNIDDNPDVPTRYAVRGIPTLILFNQGNVVATRVGSLTQTQLVAFLEDNL